MPGLDWFHVLKAEVERAAAVLGSDRLEPQSEVVTEVQAVHDASAEPTGNTCKHWDSRRPLGPLAELELVDLVARLTAKQLGEPALAATQEVDDDGIGLADHVERAIDLRH